jgi:hypothetical protein
MARAKDGPRVPASKGLQRAYQPLPGGHSAHDILGTRCLKLAHYPDMVAGSRVRNGSAGETVNV